MAHETRTMGHPELGLFLLRRTRRGFNVLLAATLAFSGLLLIGFGVAMFEPATQMKPASGITPMVILCGSGVGLLVGAVIAVRRALTTLFFYELGVVKVLLRRQTTIAYAEADRFVFEVTRHYTHGIYAGTAVDFSLKTPDRRSISYQGKFKLKARGFLKATYTATDDFDRVRRVIAEQMAVGLLDHVLGGGTLGWGGFQISSGGLTYRGFRGIVTVPFNGLGRQQAQHGYLFLFLRETNKQLGMGIPTYAVNFWPCYYVFLRLAGWVEAEQDVAASPAGSLP